jgi:pimeloyl-ACP methyl ester carboxylesterase
MSHAFMESQGNVVGVEQAYRSVREVYRFLGHEEKIGLYQQPGEHATSVEDIEQYLDFLDGVFGRKQFKKPEIWVHGYSFKRWQELSGERIDPLLFPPRSPGGFPTASAAWEQRKKEIRDRIRWALGEEPAGVPYYPGRDKLSQGGNTSGGWRGQLLQRPALGFPAASFAFGDDLRGDLYAPTGSSIRPLPGTKWPVVIWLHPYSYTTGYSRFSVWDELLNRGFAVMAFDQIGFGTRNEQSLRFYERYPKWSLMGKMVADTRAAIEALAPLDVIDSSRIYLKGWALGAKVALYTAALDDRVAAVGAACGFAPLRLDTPEKGTEGVAHYSHIHGLIPRYGFFQGYENRLPVDYDEILAAVAPKPAYIVAPTLDRYSPVADVRTAVAESRKVYGMFGKESSLTLDTPVNFCNFPGTEAETRMYDWLSKQAGLPVPAKKK